MKFAPFIIVFTLFYLIGCKEKEPKVKRTSPKRETPAQFQKPSKDPNELPKEKDKNSLLLDSLKARTASL